MHLRLRPSRKPSRSWARLPETEMKGPGRQNVRFFFNASASVRRSQRNDCTLHAASAGPAQEKLRVASWDSLGDATSCRSDSLERGVGYA